MSKFLSTTFCDDIRQEIGGKISLIGVYNGVMYVPQFPVTLPKLWLMTTLVMPYKEPPHSMKIHVTKNSEPLVDLDATEEYLQQLANSREPVVSMPTGSQRVLTSHAQVCFAPLVINEPCVLRVTATTDQGEVRGLGLQIQQQPGAAAA